MRLTIASELHWWHGHYDHVTEQPYRCGGSICAWCDAGRQPELRFVLGVTNGDGQRGLIEVRERHRVRLEAINQSEEGWVGTKIEIYKRGKHKNAPVEFDVVGHAKPTIAGVKNRARPEPWDIRLLVEALGTREQRED